MKSIVERTRNRIEKHRRSRKAISTIMANLTMLVIVVFLSSLLFVWSVSSFGAYQGGAGFFFSSRSLANQERLSVETVFFTGAGNNLVRIYVRNVGSIDMTVASVYLNSTIYQGSWQIGVNQVTSIPITLSGQTWGAGKLQTLTLATIRGTTLTTTWVA